MRGLLGQGAAQEVVPSNFVTAENVRGLAPTASYDGSFENVNLYNGSLQVRIPLFSLPGRAGHGLSVEATYSGGKVPLVERRTQQGDTGTICVRRTADFAGPWDLFVRLAPELEYVAGEFQFPGSDLAKRRHRYVLTETDGSTLEFREVSGRPDYFRSEWEQAERFRSTGGTYLSLQEVNSVPGAPVEVTVYSPDGGRLVFDNRLPPTGHHPSFRARAVYDRHGNRIDYLFDDEVALTAEDRAFIAAAQQAGDTVQVSGVRDTLGRQVTRLARHRLLTGCPRGDLGCGEVPFGLREVETLVRVRSSGGAWRTYRLAHQGVTGGGPLTSTLDLPSGRSYRFEWTTAGPFDYICTLRPLTIADTRLARVDYPNGGYTRYSWEPFSDTTAVVGRHLCPDAGGSCATEESTTYERSSPVGPVDVRVGLPDGTARLHRFRLFSSDEIGSFPLEAAVETHGAGGELIRSRITFWDPGRSNPRVEEELEVLHRTGEKRSTRFQHDRAGYLIPAFGNRPAFQETAGNVTLREETDWGAGAPGPVLRRTRTRYLIEDDPAYGVRSANHLLRLPASTEISGGAGDLAARTELTYDGYGPGEPLARPGAIQHEPPAGGSHRGNLTRTEQSVIRHWPGSGTDLSQTPQRAARSTHYDVLGNVVATVDAEDRVTTHSYVDQWEGEACRPPGPTFALATTSDNPLGHATRRWFHACGSQLARVVDPNDNPTLFSYDAVDRLRRTILPDGGQEDWFYSDSDPLARHRGERVFDRSTAQPLRIARFEKIDAARDSEEIRILDGLGRPVIAGTRNGSDFDWTKTVYDVRGRVAQSSNPITAGKAAGSDAPDATVFGNWTTSRYDALGRTVEQVAPDGSRTTWAYEGSEVLFVDPAGVQRLSASDGLGRLVEVTESLDGATLRTGRGKSSTADLSLAIDAPADVAAGQSLTYRLTVSNAGPQAAGDLSIAVTLPAGVTFLTGSGSSWGTCEVAATLVTCPGTVDLAAGASGLLLVTARVDAEAGELAMAARVGSGAAADPAPADNTARASTSVRVTAEADLELTQRASAGSVLGRKTVLLTLTLVNHGLAAAEGVEVSDLLPEGARLVRAAGDGFACGEASGVVTCQAAGDLAVGMHRLELEIETPGTPAWLENTARVFSSSPDPNPANHSPAPLELEVYAVVPVRIGIPTLFVPVHPERP